MSSTTGVWVAKDPSEAMDRLNNGASRPRTERKRSLNSQVSQVAERTITGLSSTTGKQGRVTARDYLNLMNPPKRDAVAVADGAQARSLSDDLENGREDSSRQTINNTNQNNNSKENNMMPIKLNGTGFSQQFVEEKSKNNKLGNRGAALQGEVSGVEATDLKAVKNAMKVIGNQGHLTSKQMDRIEQWTHNGMMTHAKAINNAKNKREVIETLSKAIDDNEKKSEELTEKLNKAQINADEKNSQSSEKTTFLKTKQEMLGGMVIEKQKQMQGDFKFLAVRIAELSKGKSGKELTLARLKQIALFVVYLIGSIFMGISELMNYLITTSKDEARKKLMEDGSEYNDLKKNVDTLSKEAGVLTQEKAEADVEVTNLTKELKKLEAKCASEIEKCIKLAGELDGEEEIKKTNRSFGWPTGTTAVTTGNDSNALNLKVKVLSLSVGDTPFSDLEPVNKSYNMSKSEIEDKIQKKEKTKIGLKNALESAELANDNVRASYCKGAIIDIEKELSELEFFLSPT